MLFYFAFLAFVGVKEQSLYRGRSHVKQSKGELHMNREKLKELGLTEEQVESVIALHGASVHGMNTKISELQTSENALKQQIAERDKDLKNLKSQVDDNEELKGKFADLQKQYQSQKEDYEKELVAVKRDAEINRVLSDSKAKNIKALRALLDEEAITFKDGKVVGLDEQIKSLKESDGYLFNGETKPSGYDPKQGNTPTGNLTFEQAMKEDKLDAFFEQQEQLQQKEE